MAGDKAAARERYARLLQLWSDADADILDLADAKARLAALEANRQAVAAHPAAKCTSAAD